jgi:drug/metabolite transporter (DMT)-like permease
MMLGILSAFVSALFASLNDVTKKYVLKDISEITLITVSNFIWFLIFAAINLVVGIPNVDSYFWTAVYVSASLNMFASMLILRALKTSDISSTLPLISLSPAFLLVTSFLILGETPSPLGIIGVLLIVAGTYAINLHKSKSGLAEPLLELFRNHGSRLALIVGVIYGFTGPFDKIAIQHSNIFMYPLAFTALSLLMFFPLFIFRVSKKEKKVLGTSTKWLVLIGVVGTFVSIFQNIAYSLTLVPYAIAVKRTGVLFSVIFGGMFFKEEYLRQRIFAALIMVAGLALIVLGNI